MAFTIVLQNILIMLFYMAIGFSLSKAKLASESHARTLSAILVYACTPGMILSSFQEATYNPSDAKSLFLFFLASLLLQLLFYALMTLLLGKKMKEAKYRIMTAGSALGNVGYIGGALATALFPTQAIATCYAMVFSASMNILVFTIGEYLITQDKKYISIKKIFINPTIPAMILSIVMYLLQIKLPKTILSVPSTLRAMSLPLCMFILGIRLSVMKFSDVFCNVFAYATSAIKLLVFPLFCYLCVYFLPFVDNTFKACMLIISACPCATLILSMAELHEMEREKAAYTVLVSSILCVVTLPLLSLLVQ